MNNYSKIIVQIKAIKLIICILFLFCIMASRNVLAEQFESSVNGETLIWDVPELSNISFEGQRIFDLGSSIHYVFDYTAIFPGDGETLTLTAEITPYSFFGSS